MAACKLAQAAKGDLQRIYAYGLERWGAAAADSYYNALFDRFEEIAERPYSYPAVDVREPLTFTAPALMASASSSIVTTSST